MLCRDFVTFHGVGSNKILDGIYKEKRVDNMGEKHTHIAEDGTVYEHEHGHRHTHTHQNTRAVLNRLSRAIGHMESVKRMVEEGRDCSEVLVQLAAVRSAINNTGKVILKDHLEHCVADALEARDRTAIDELNRAIEQFVK